MKKILFILSSVMCLHSTGQYTNRAKLPKVDSVGYYRIALNHEITSRLNNNFGNLRIVNSNGDEIPYLLKTEVPSQTKQGWEPYDIINKEYNIIHGWESRYTIKRKDTLPIDKLVLAFANFDDTRYVRLSGSNDNQQWFVIKDGYTLYNAFSQTESYQNIKLKFPLSNYQYFRIEVQESWNNQPLNMLSAGNFQSVRINGSYFPVPFPQFVLHQKNDKKITVINFPFFEGNYFDKMTFSISEPEQYHRRAVIYNKIMENDSTFHREKLKEFYFTSTAPNVLTFNHVHSNSIQIEIMDNDDSPLLFNSFKFFQLNTYLMAKLDNKENYELVFGGDSIASPIYDLTFFKNNLDSLSPIIKPQSSIYIATLDPIQDSEELSFYETPLFTWSAIVIVALLLVVFSIKLLADMKKKEGNEES